MGIFSKKPPCAICGGKVGFLLPTKIEGEYICDECALKIDMSPEKRSGLTMDGLRSYLEYYDRCQPLRESFVVGRQIDFGMLDTKIIFDFEHRLFAMSKRPDKTVFQGSQLKSFVIKEDNTPIFEGSSRGLIRYTSTVPQQVAAMGPQLNMIAMSHQMTEAMDRLRDDDRPQYRHTQNIREPFNNFNVEIYLEHPYFDQLKCDMSGPDFDNEHPDAGEYLDSYYADFNTMEQLAVALMQVGFPMAGEMQMGTYAQAAAQPQMQPAVQPVAQPAAAPAGGDAVEQLKKYKELAQAGVITEEEFSAKKKQLLGL